MGATGTPASWSAWATRWARIAWTPPQLSRISTLPTRRAAGSRSRAEAISERISRATRLRVSNPGMAKSVRVELFGREERERHVALPAVGDDHDDPLAGQLRAGPELQRRLDGRSRRDPDQQPLALGGVARPCERGLVVDGDHLVDHLTVQHLRHEAGSDALDLVRARQTSGDRKSTRLNSSHLGISYAVFCLK